MIMVATTRAQNRNDHRLRQLVQATQDVSYTIECGVPRSTARGWLNAPSVEVVTLDSLDMDAAQLQREVLRLNTRIRNDPSTPRDTPGLGLCQNHLAWQGRANR